MKNYAYTIAFIVACIAAYFQAEQETTAGAYMLLFAINLTGVFLFIFASAMPDTERFGQRFKALPGWIILAGALIVRAYTFFYIPAVYSGPEMWHLLTVNVILLFVELGIFFYGDPDNQAWEQKAEAREAKEYAAQKETELNELNIQIERLEKEFEIQKDLFKDIRFELNKANEQNAELKQENERLKNEQKNVSTPVRAKAKRTNKKTNQDISDEQILNAAKRLYQQTGKRPSYQKIADEIGCVKSTVYSRVQSMNGQFEKATS